MVWGRIRGELEVKDLGGEVKKLQNRQFQPHDARETASRFRLPAPRQVYIVNEAGERVNSAEGQKRGMPPYLLIVDLTFATASFQAAKVLEHSDIFGVPYFFMLLFSIVWIWVKLNTRLNCYDPEDLSFELFILAISTSVIACAFHIPPCFLTDATRAGGGEGLDAAAQVHCANLTIPALAAGVLEAPGDATACDEMARVVNATCAPPPEPRAPSRAHTGSIFSAGANECFDFVAFLAFTRLLLVGLHVWIAVHVPLVRKSIFFCESLSSLAWMPIMAVLLHKTSSPSERDSYTEGSLAIMLVMATLLDIVAVHGPAIFRKSVPKPFRGQIEKFIPAVPLNIAYAEARNERLIIIGIGTVIAEGLRQVRRPSECMWSASRAPSRPALTTAPADWPPQLNNARETITVDQEFTVYVAVPLTVFLIKVYFFDLSPHFGDTSKNTHAMRVSRRRGLAFNLLHVPTFGAIIWISSALGGLIAQGAANTARWEVEVRFALNCT